MKAPVVNGSPTKDFFIDMLTRDISISDCILDLIDNPVSNEVERLHVDVMNYFRGERAGRARAKIRLMFDRSHFRITDDAGGISSQDASEEVFRLGNPDANAKTPTLSVYGIGMKRALFKMGRLMLLRSATRDEEFVLEFDVDRWRTIADSWDLEFERVGPLVAKSRRNTTDLLIKRLLGSTKERLGSSTFEADLLRRIGRTHGLFLQAGIEISVNGKVAKPELPTLTSTSNVKPVRRTFREDGVDVLIIAGVTPLHDRVPRGWYVYCNGRLVLDGDKSELTGWGSDGTPQFRAKYNHFAGILLLKSKDPRRLPWTTTKQGIDRDAPIYQSALAEMMGRLDYLTKLSFGDPGLDRLTQEIERLSLRVEQAKRNLQTHRNEHGC